MCSNQCHPDRERLRREWGCDAPTAEPQFAIECYVCSGLDPSCSECSGHGQIEFHRCPNTFVRDEHREIVRSASFLEAGVLPAAGGWADQAATWIDAVCLVSAEVAKYRRNARSKE